MEQTIDEKLNKAYKCFQDGNTTDAETLIIDAMESNVNQFMAWWITEKNPEYQLTSRKFLLFIKKIVTKHYGRK